MSTVLIIDDDDSARQLMAYILRDAGHDVVEATNGRRGMQLAEEVSPDVIVTDIFMPERDGLEVILKLKRKDPGVRIIAISGGNSYLGFDPLQTAKDFGAVKCLAKPISSDELRKIVDEVMS